MGTHLLSLKPKFLKSFLLLSLLTALSCGSSETQMEFQELPTTGWPQHTPVRFSLQVNDSLHPHDIFIHLRHSNDYPFSNIFLITSLSHPNGEVITDTLSYDLAAANGLWLGSGSGIITQSLPYKKNVIFNTSKPYTLSVYQSVRELGATKGIAVLPAITEVGYSLKKERP